MLFPTPKAGGWRPRLGLGLSVGPDALLQDGVPPHQRDLNHPLVAATEPATESAHGTKGREGVEGLLSREPIVLGT